MKKTNWCKARQSLAVICAVTLLFTALFSGCSAKRSEQQDFDTFLDRLPTRLIANDDLNLEFLFQNPEDYGFEPELLTLPFTDREGWDESMEECRNLLAELEEYDRSQMDETSGLTYDILKDYLQRQLMLAPYYDLNNSYLGSFIGFQAQLPLLLNEFQFDREEDIDSYFHILETSEETFLAYAQIEKERLEHGVGMNQSLLDLVVEQCENFVSRGDDFLVESFEAAIEDVDFLTDQEKQEKIETATRLLREDFIEAYRKLGEALSSLEGRTDDLGLAAVTDGKEYYETLLQASTGVDMSIEEIKNYLQNKEMSLALEMYGLMQQLQQSDPQRYEALMQSLEINYPDLGSVEDTISYLREECLQDYPSLPQLQFKVVQVPQAMQDNFSPAAYLQGRLDQPADLPQAIYLNGEFDSDLFLTIAHEGYPGHMYQHTYFLSLGLPTVRYLLDYSGYSEGWATYVEWNAYRYVGDDMLAAQIESLNAQLTGVIISLSDIGIHYDGWDVEQFGEFLTTYFGEGLSQEDIRSQYMLSLETPTNYLQYYLTGLLYQDLEADAREQLGDRFSLTGFHEVLLKTGPAPLAIIEREVNQWIANIEADASLSSAA